MEIENEREQEKAKKEEIDRWLNFLSMIYAHPISNKEARKKFMDLIKPKIQEASPTTSKKYETDIELLKRLKEMQEGGAKSANNPGVKS